MPSFIAGIARQQLSDMESLHRDFGRKPSRRKRRQLAEAEREVAAARQPSIVWALPHQTGRAPGVSASTKGATGL